MARGGERDDDRLPDSEGPKQSIDPRPIESQRLEDLLAKHRGSVERGSGAREVIELLRDDWR